MQPATGDLRSGRQQGPSLPDGLSRGWDPRGLFAWVPARRREGRSRARSPRPLRAARAPEPARGQRSARGRVPAHGSLAVTCFTRRGTRPLPLPIRRVQARPGICVLPRARAGGAPRLPDPGHRPPSPGPSPQDSGSRCARPGRPSAPLPFSELGVGRGGGRARAHLCFPIPPAARSRPQAAFGPGFPAGATGATSHRPVRGAPGGRAACAQQRRPCVPYAASGARPPLFSFPGSLAVAVCGSARAHKELRRRPRARPRGRSRRRRRRGGGGRASVQLRARAR